MNKPFWRIRIPLRCALVLLFGLLPEAAGQQSEGGDQQECRAGFDVGSSGIRLGSNSGEADNAESRPINYLADLNENNDEFKVTTIDKRSAGSKSSAPNRVAQRLQNRRWWFFGVAARCTGRRSR